MKRDRKAVREAWRALRRARCALRMEQRAVRDGSLVREERRIACRRFERAYQRLKGNRLALALALGFVRR